MRAGTMPTRMVLKPAEVPALNPKAAGQLLKLARPQPKMPGGDARHPYGKRPPGGGLEPA